MTDLQLLLWYYERVKEIILLKQHPITGLLPASTAITKHGNYTDAWVRDNVYSILCVWGLSLAMKKNGSMPAEQFDLEQSTIRLMRGLLRSMMQQCDKVEKFKSSLALHDALHAKYDTATGAVVVADHEWGHLQIDATSLYMIALTQMIKSGLTIITNIHEVDFIQNLVYYVERAYRTPDYGIWERGEKSNIGYVELNSSSLGMAKSALRALAGFNLLGPYGSQHSTIHVLPDNLALAEITLHSLLPRESVTKEIDSALLSIIGFPAFAIEDPKLVSTVQHAIRSKLSGNYGYKRFLRDGHQTVMEDTSRHFYNEEELRQFEDIECEWPLFYSYELLNACYQDKPEDAQKFYTALQRVMVEQNKRNLLPELYYVPAELVEAEKKKPHSQKRIPNNNLPLVWAQSLFYLGALMKDGLIRPDDLDPVGLHRMKKPTNTVVQVLLLAETPELREKLRIQGLQVQTLDDLPEDTFVCMPDQIAILYNQIGENKKLGLTGRPIRRLKSLTTSKIFTLYGKNYVCLSLFFLEKEFYLTFDSRFLIERFKNELNYIYRHWSYQQRPIVAIMLTSNLVNRGLHDFKVLYDLLQTGTIGEVPIYMSTFQNLNGHARRENLDELGDQIIPHLANKTLVKVTNYLAFSEEGLPLTNEAEQLIEAEIDPYILIERLRTSSNLYEHIKLLDNLVTKNDLRFTISINDQDISLRDLLTEVYERAGALRIWNVVRHAAALLGKIDIDLQFAITSLLIHHKIIQVGKAFTDDSLILRPLPFDTLVAKINKYCREDQRDKVLTQEVLVYLGILVRSDPKLFTDLITIRVSYIILLIIGELARRDDLLQEDAYEKLLGLPPSEVQILLRNILDKYTLAGRNLQKLESMHTQQTSKPLIWNSDSLVSNTEAPEEGWLIWRRSQGTLHIAGEVFYSRVWNIFKQSEGIIIGDKLDRRNRLESRIILSDMTSGEKAFQFRIEYLLNKIQAPEYRYLTMEAMMVTASFSLQNPDLYIDDFVVFDIINGHAVRLAFTESFPDLAKSYHDHKADAWTHFYQLPPVQTSRFIVKSIMFLLKAVAQNKD